MATVLTRKVARRKGLRATAISLCKRIDDIVNEFTEEKRVNVMALQTTLLDTIQQLKELDDEICASMTPEDIEADVAETMEFYLHVNLTSTALGNILAPLPSSAPIPSETSRASEKASVKLPKVNIQPFEGNPLHWQSFWDQYNSGVHEKEYLNPIDKFNYLKGYLRGTALSTVSGLELTNNNYESAIKLLRDRFGNEQVLINAHMETLLKIDPVRSMRDIGLLRKFYNDVENCVRNLKSLNYDSERLSLMIPILNERLPNELRMIVSRRFGGNNWSLETMLEFINEEVQARERCFSSSMIQNEQSRNHGNHKPRIGSADCLLNVNKSSGCVFCHENHSPSRCNNVTNCRTRVNILKKEGRCFLCLQHGHITKNCLSNYTCNRCGKQHHISLCMKEKYKEQGDSEENPSQTNAYCVKEENNGGILLQTAKAFVSKNVDERDVQTRFLFDSGSQRTYVTNELKERLNLETVRKEKLIINTFGHSKSELKELPVVKFFVRTFKGIVAVEAITVPKICAPLVNQNSKYYLENYENFRPLKLADYTNGKTKLDVHVLIGLDYYYAFVTGEVVRNKNGGPTAINSKLGWILSGGHNSQNTESNCMEIHTCRVNTENKLLCEELNKFWQVESIGDNENQNVLTSFKDTIKFNGERYVTELPFRPDHDQLPDNFAVAKQRLESLVDKRLRTDPALAAQYNDVFADYESKHIVERVPENEIACENAYYLPHHPVVRQDKTTTKVRPVFDGSCNVHKPSLNEILYSGPNLLSKVFDLLLRFRTNYIALIADIQQAFLNVEVAEKDRDVLRFLWKENPTEKESKLVIFRFLRVVIGLTCSPFLLNSTIKHHLETYEMMFPEITDILADDLYVDDLTTGVDSVTKGKELYETSKTIMKDGGFNLRKWMTNNHELREYIDEIEKSNRNETNPKVLGIEWNTEKDTLIYRFDELLERAAELQPTKRNILRVSASFYDPLGLIAPITTKVKVLFQRCCQNKSDWDEPLEGELLTHWNELLNDLRTLQTFEIRRYLFCQPRHQIKSIELHGFCDSSKIAYAAVIYAKIRTNLGVSVSLMSAKTKVAPLKPHSIPRLELLACVLLAKLTNCVVKAIDGRLNVDKVFAWSDSEVALCWLKSKLKQWKPWVENRVIYIRSIIPPDSWFHVSTAHNPSDIPTRPKRVSEFNCKLWLNGPDFLHDVSFEPPEFHLNERSSDVLSEVKKCHVMSNSLHIQSSHNHSQVHDIIDESKFNSLNKLVTTLGYVHRFVNKLLTRIGKRDIATSSERELSTEEFKDAFDLLITNNQRKFQSNETYFKKLSASLKVFEDKDDNLRVQGRFGQNEKLTYDERYPLILPNDYHLTKLIVMDAHEKTLHQGIEATMNMMRQRFWIPKARRTIKSILRRCVICRRYQGKPINSPPTPNLPDYRFSASRAFQHIGFDHAGPLYIRTGKQSTAKAYVLLLTCATTRAVHFELSPDLKAPAFIRAFKRFCSRRGVPTIVVHDNFKTFKSSHVKRFMRHERIESKPILPKSPWWGGFYERIVRTMKTALRKTIGKSLLTYEELETILCQVEASINARPLAYKSEDDIGQAITPLHLIYGFQASNVEFIPMNNPDQCLNRMKYLQRVVEDQWKRFYRTYLNELRQHHLYRKDGKNIPDLKLNDVVVIKDDNPLPRSKWPLGKVNELITGPDGLIRGAKIRVITKTGQASVITRPVQKLIPLEVSETRTDDKPAKDTGRLSRPTRKAAKDGQIMRRLRERYF